MHGKRRKLLVIEAFQHFGTKPTNINWSWSGRGQGSGGSTIVTVSVFQHDLQMVKGMLTFVGSLNDHRPGAGELKKNLQLAVERCGGRVNVVIVKAHDPLAKKIRVAERFPASFTMLVKQLDFESGTFRLEIERDDILAAA